MVPAVLVEGLCGGFVILVVAEHHVGAACKDLAWDVGRVGAVYLHLHVEGCTSAAARGEVLPVVIADDGCAFGGTVAHGVGEVDALEELLHLLVEGSATDDDFVEIASEGVDHLFADLLLDLLGDDGHVEQEAHAVVLYLWKYLFLDDLLDDQRHGDDDGRADVGKGLGDDGR